MEKDIKILDVLFQKGYSLYWEGDFKSALKVFDKSIKKYGEHYLKTYYKGQAIRDQGKLTESIQYFMDAIKQKDDFVRGYISLARVYKRLKNYEESLKTLKIALEKHPSLEEENSIRQNRVELINILKKQRIKIDFLDDFEKGIWSHSQAYKGKASECLDDYIKTHPEDHLVYLYSAIAYYELHEINKGLERIDKFIEFEPEYGKGWHVKAQLLALKKDYNLAAECCEKAIALNPKITAFKDTLSRINSAKRKEIQPKKKPIGRKKASPPRREVKGSRDESPFPPLFGIALVLHTVKKHIGDRSKDARETSNFLGRFKFDEYVMLQIDFEAMYYTITDQITHPETIQETTELSSKLMHFSIKDPKAFDLFNEALGHIAKSQYGKGIELLEKAIELSPNNPMYMADLFKTYQQIGNIKKAKEIRKSVEEKLSNLKSKEYQKSEFETAKQRLTNEVEYFNNLLRKYQTIIMDEKGIITLITNLTSEIVHHLKGEETKLKEVEIPNVIDDCLYCFELLSLVASLVFFKLHFKLGDAQLFNMIKKKIIEILGWEPEPLPSIQTPNFLSPRLRQKAWLSTLGMDVLSGSMMDSIKEARYVHIDGDVGNDDPETHVWYSKATADQINIGKQHVTHDTSERDKIAEYLKAQFGEPLTVIHDKGDQIVHIDIYVYPPTKERKFGMMITSGMSERPMNAPPDAWKVWPIDITKVPEEKREALNCKYAELVVKLPPDWPLPQPGGHLQNDQYLWPIAELHHLIYYVHKYKEWFWDGHTMRSSALSLASNTKLAGWVFLYPPHFPPTFGMLKISDSKAICFLQIIPAYMEEIQYAMQHDTQKLFAKFREAQIPDYIDITRKNTCL